MRFLVTTLIYVVLMSGVACYGAWLMDWEEENQFYHHPNSLEEMCMIVASSPGYRTWLSVTKPLDDDRGPPVWPHAWFVGPLSGLVWGFALSATAHSILGLSALVIRKKPLHNIS